MQRILWMPFKALPRATTLRFRELGLPGVWDIAGEARTAFHLAARLTGDWRSGHLGSSSSRIWRTLVHFPHWQRVRVPQRRPCGPRKQELIWSPALLPGVATTIEAVRGCDNVATMSVKTVVKRWLIHRHTACVAHDLVAHVRRLIPDREASALNTHACLCGAIAAMLACAPSHGLAMVRLGAIRGPPTPYEAGAKPIALFVAFAGPTTWNIFSGAAARCVRSTAMGLGCLRNLADAFCLLPSWHAAPGQSALVAPARSCYDVHHKRPETGRPAKIWRADGSFIVPHAILFDVRHGPKRHVSVGVGSSHA